MVDYRSDQFTLGAILYEMATGRQAFRRETPAQTMAAIIDATPEPLATLNPQVPPPLRWLIEGRCLAKEPNERYAATQDLARELRDLRERLSGSDASSSSPQAAGVPRSDGVASRAWPRPASWRWPSSGVRARCGTVHGAEPDPRRTGPWWSRCCLSPTSPATRGTTPRRRGSSRSSWTRCPRSTASRSCPGPRRSPSPTARAISRASPARSTRATSSTACFSGRRTGCGSA